MPRTWGKKVCGGLGGWGGWGGYVNLFKAFGQDLDQRLKVAQAEQQEQPFTKIKQNNVDYRSVCT